MDARPKLHSAQSSMSSIGGSQWTRLRPSSPTRSETTTASRADFTNPPHLLISRADLRKSIAALEELTQQAKSFRQALLTVSKATSALASALEDCSRVKGCDTASDGLMALSGLKYMMGAHQQLMGDTFYREFEIPLLEKLDDYRAAVTERQVQYEKALQVKSALIRKTEHDNIRHGRKKRRDLQQFRAALVALQQQVDDLDGLKGSHYQEILEAEDELWSGVLAKTVFVARAEMDVYDKIASKSTDPSLESLLSSIPDPFGSWGPQREEGQLFSVLSPLGLMGGMKSPKPKLSRNTSTFRELRVTEEDEENLEDSIIVDTPREGMSTPADHTDRQEDEEVVKTTEPPTESNHAEVEPFVLPSPDPVDPSSNNQGTTAAVPKEDKMIATEDEADPEDEAGNDSGVASSAPSERGTALGLSMPSLMPGERREWREPWQRILWKQQEGYDDDYVPDSFLAAERKKLETSGPQGPSVMTLFKREVIPQATFFFFVGFFVLVFRALLLDQIKASHLNSFNLLGVIILASVSKWRRASKTIRDGFKSDVDGPDMTLSWLLPPFVLYICSPLLLSLTKATTSDSIWPLSGGLFLLASVLGGFGSNVGFGKQDGRADVARSVRGRSAPVRRSSVGELTLVDKSQSLQSCLSLTAALSACIVMASRLDSGREVFALLSFVGLMIVTMIKISQSA